MSVLDNILADISAQLKIVAAAAGYPNAEIVLDEYSLANFPPDPESEDPLDEGLQFVIQLGQFSEGRPLLSNCDRWLQMVQIGTTLNNAQPTNEEGDLTDKVESLLAATIKQLRVDRYRGGNADDTNHFSGRRWAFGDGSAAGFQIGCEVLYRTAYNDPDTPG